MMKGGCLMDSLSNMNKAMEYIEEHLAEEIDYSDIDCKIELTLDRQTKLTHL